MTDLAFEIVELNAWEIDGRWYYGHTVRNADDFLSVLSFRVESDDVVVQGWLPLRANQSAMSIHRGSDRALIYWVDGSLHTVLYERIEPVYWRTISGHGHTNADLGEIRVALGGA